MRVSARDFDSRAALRSSDIDHRPELAPGKLRRDRLSRHKAPCCHPIQKYLLHGMVVVQGLVGSDASFRRSACPERLSQQAPILIVPRIEMLEQAAKVSRL